MSISPEENIKNLESQSSDLDPTPTLTQKQGRKKRVVPDTIVIEKPEVETISYSKAEKLTRTKREMSDKQKENIIKLIALNKERREREKEEIAKQMKLQEAKAKQKTLVVLPKKIRKKKVKSTFQNKEDESEEDDEKMPTPKYIPHETDGDTTDTREIKEKVKKLETINKSLKEKEKQPINPSNSNPYKNILKNSGFVMFS